MQPLYLVVQEEIGLEGLDGITLNGETEDTQQVDCFFVKFLTLSFVVPTLRATQARAAAE